MDLKNPRENNFDWLRFMLAALVIFSHSFPLSGAGNQHEPLYKLTRGQATLGEVAVDGFFIISGFLITWSWFNSASLRKFLWKRACRIYPAFAVVLLITIAILIPLNMANPRVLLNGHELWRMIWGTISLKGYEHPATFPNNSVHAVNGSLWSIRFEVWCYVGVAALGVFGLLRRRVVLGLFVLSLPIAFVFNYFNLHPGGKFLGWIFGSPHDWSRMLPFFLSGMVAYFNREKLSCDWRLAVLALLALIAGSQVKHAYSVLLPTAGAMLIYWAAFSPSIRMHRWGEHGDFSYGLYLWGYPIQQIMVSMMGSVSPLVLCAYALPTAVLAGMISWHVVEKRFLHRKQARPATMVVAAPPLVEVAS